MIINIIGILKCKICFFTPGDNIEEKPQMKNYRYKFTENCAGRFTHHDQWNILFHVEYMDDHN